MKTTRRVKNIITIWLCAILVIAGFGVQSMLAPEVVWAAADEVRIDVNQVFTEENAPEGKKVEYSLSSRNGKLPDGTNGGDYRFEIDGTATAEIVMKDFDDTGTYEYLLKTVPDSREYYKFDKKEYRIVVYASAAGYDVFIYNEDNSKIAAAEFTQSYGHADPFIVVDPPVKKRITGTPTEDEDRMAL